MTLRTTVSRAGHGAMTGQGAARAGRAGSTSPEPVAAISAVAAARRTVHAATIGRAGTIAPGRTTGRGEMTVRDGTTGPSGRAAVPATRTVGAIAVVAGPVPVTPVVAAHGIAVDSETARPATGPPVTAGTPGMAVLSATVGIAVVIRAVDRGTVAGRPPGRAETEAAIRSRSPAIAARATGRHRVVRTGR